MTRQRDFKSLVRERMEKTGERYTTARAQLLKKLNPPADANECPGLLPGYDRFGGVCDDTAVLTNMLRQAGIKNPLSKQPFDETTVNGLCGGPGFLYAAFEYKGWPPMLTMVLRSRSMPDVYIGEGLKRLGVKFTEKQSSTPKAARKTLDDALSAGKAAMCTIDNASLPWYGLPKEFVGMGPHIVCAAGHEGDHVWLDDRSPRPMRVAFDVLADARARYRAGKSRLITAGGRVWYADFLESTADLISAPLLKEAAKAYRQAGARFAEIAQIIADCGDPAITKSCELADRRAELRDNLHNASTDASADEFRQMWLRRSKLGGECKLTKDAASAIFGKIAQVAEKLLNAERSAAEQLERVE